jgi:putative ABC transport system permease protein
MLKNYFRVALRNFWRNRAFSAINILGLAIGISASLIIYLLVYYDFTFDKFEKDGDRIYRIVATGTFQGNTWHNNCLPEPMGPAVEKDLAGMEVVTPFTTADELRVTIPHSDGSQSAVFKKQKDVVFVDKRYFELIRYSWLAGSPTTSLQEPYEVVLTEKDARLYFPRLNYAEILGKTILFNDSILTKVTGIVKDIAQNTDFYFNSFVSRSTLYTSRLKPGGFGRWDWTNSADQLFVRLTPGNSAARMDPQLNRLWKKYNPPNPDDHGATMSLQLQPLSDLHFDTDYGVFDESRQAHKPTLYGLLAVAGFLLLLACINFINLSTAQASQRAKEIGIRKTMGSHRRQLTVQFLSETFLLTTAATLLSIALTPLLLKVFADFIPEDFHFSLLRQPLIPLFLLALIVVVSLLAGFYPALVMSAFRPALVLKNQAFTGSGKTRGAWLRKILTVSQFVIAQVFLIGTLLVTKQISFALSKDLGFRREAIVYFHTNYHEPVQKEEFLVQKLRQLPGIALISVASNPPTSNGTWTSTMTYNDGKKDIIQNVEWKVADSNYFRMFGLHLLAGNTIAQSDTTNSVVINTTYLHILGFQDPRKALNIVLSGGNGKPRIVGVMADFNQRSLREKVKPLLIANGTRTNHGCINIALQPSNGNVAAWPATMASVEKAFKSVYPNDDFDYQFIDDTIAKFYTTEKNTANLLFWSAGLTIFISCLGLLGLVIYITNQRTKEIGIRKVIGASISQIILLLSKDFLRLIGLAILIAIPIAWWGTNKWLEDFEYKTALSWWVFALGGGVLLVIALIVLCLRTFRAAAVNPVRSLRSE